MQGIVWGVCLRLLHCLQYTLTLHLIIINVICSFVLIRNDETFFRLVLMKWWRKQTTTSFITIQMLQWIKRAIKCYDLWCETITATVVHTYFIDVHIHIFCNISYHFITSLFDALTDSGVCKYFTQLLSNGTQSELVCIFKEIWRKWRLIFSMVKFEIKLQQMCRFRRHKLYLILYISSTDSLHWNLRKTERHKTKSSHKY